MLWLYFGDMLHDVGLNVSIAALASNSKRMRRVSCVHFKSLKQISTLFGRLTQDRDSEFLSQT